MLWYSLDSLGSVASRVEGAEDALVLPGFVGFDGALKKKARGVCLLKLKVPQVRSLSAYAWSPNACTRICAIWSQYLAGQQFWSLERHHDVAGEVARARSLGSMSVMHVRLSRTFALVNRVLRNSVQFV